MEQDKELIVFIVEDKQVARQIMEYMQKNKVTYAEIFNIEKRPEIVEVLSKISQ